MQNAERQLILTVGVLVGSGMTALVNWALGVGYGIGSGLIAVLLYVMQLRRERDAALNRLQGTSL